MAKVEREFAQPDSAWIPDPRVTGLFERILSRDPETGDYTRQLRFDPGTDTTPNGTLTHPFWEEVYILEGELTDLVLGKTFPSGSYACRPPGMRHGPWRTATGCITLEVRYFTKVTPGLLGLRVLITGASGGIGRAVARELAAGGAVLALSGRDEERLQRVSEPLSRFGSPAACIPGDLTKPDAALRIVSTAVERLGGLDGLVNAAGGHADGGVVAADDRDWMENIELKLMGAVRMTRAALPALTQSRGVIVNVAGGSGRNPSPHSAVNSVVNAGLMALSDLVAKEVLPAGVRVIAINPGLTETPLLDQILKTRAAARHLDPQQLGREMASRRLNGRFVHPREVAQTVAFLLSPQAAMMSGITVDMGGPRA